MTLQLSLLEGGGRGKNTGTCGLLIYWDKWEEGEKGRKGFLVLLPFTP